MKKTFRKFFLIFLDYVAAGLAAFVINIKARRYLDYLICGQVEPCGDKAGCLPCQYALNSGGVFGLRPQYLILSIATIIIFSTLSFFFYLFTKKHFKIN